MSRAAAVVLPLLLVGAACEEPIDDFPRRAVDRSDRAPDPDGAWSSGPWPGGIADVDREGFIEIAPTAGIELVHGLGRAPTAIQCYVGFSEEPARAMPSAGNACEIHDVDATTILVRNGSGGSFFYRFVLR